MDISKFTDAELKALEDAYDGKELDLSGFTEERRELMAQAWDEANADIPPAPEEPGIGKQALDYGLRGLDYLGGATRTTAANVGDELAQLFGAYDNDRINAKDTMLAALKGKAPTTADYLEQAGVPKGASVNLLPESFPLGLGEGDTSVRGAAGFVGDVALDPLTYASLGSTAIGKKIIQESGEAGLRGAAGKAARVGMNLFDPSDLVKVGGKKLYQSGLKKADIVAKKFGKGDKALSETLLRNRVTGSAEDIATQATKLASDLAAEQQAILAQASAKGATVDLKQTFKPVLQGANAVEKGANLPSVQRAAKAFKQELSLIASKYGARAERTVTEGLGEQASMFAPNDLPKAVTSKQLYTNADEAIKAVPTGGAQMGLDLGPSLLDDAATLSSKADPNAALYEEIVTRGEIPKGQPELFTPADYMQPAKTTVIPGSSGLSVTDASRIKSQIYNLAGDQAYNTLSRDKTGAKLLKTAGNRVKSAVEKSVNAVDAGLGSRLKEVNRDLGNSLSSRKVLESEAGKEIAKNSLSSVDAALLWASPQVAAAKKVGDVLKGTSFRTNVGDKLFYNPNKVAAPLRRTLLNTTRQKEQE